MSIEVMRKLADAYKQVNEKKKKLDPVVKDELKGSHADRDDKDIDNDGDADNSDEFLHKKRKAISKNVKKKGKDEDVSMNPKMNKELLPHPPILQTPKTNHSSSWSFEDAGRSYE